MSFRLLPLAAALAAVTGLHGLGCAGPADVPADSALLALGEQRVLLSEFQQHVSRLESQGGPLEPEVRQQLLESFLEERVLVLEARARHLVAPDASSEEEQAAVQQLLAEAVLPAIQIDETEIEDYYAQHGEALRLPETVRVRQVLVPTLNEARDVYRRLAKDRRSFGLLARTRSRGPEAEAGGLMGTFERGQLPQELDRVVFDLTPGRVGPIVQSPLGFHVLMVDERSAPRERTLDECREEIHARLMRQAYDAAVRRYIAGLMARAEVNHEAVPSDPVPSPS